MTDLELRFWDRVRVGDGCWEWFGEFGHGGYGKYRPASTQQKVIKAHRQAWIWIHGSIPAGKLVLHRCDNRKCVRPGHLFVGTHAENMADMLAKGRSAYGERGGHAVLTEAQMQDVYRDVKYRGKSERETARRFGVTRGAVQGIVNLKTWKRIPRVEA